MSRHVFAMAFAIGLLAVAWVGSGFVGTSWLALAMTAAIGAVYLIGALELRQFRAASAALSGALADLAEPLPGVGEWLGRVPVSLRHAVRLRLEGERAGLPGPALTPYLVGLLVMLGMLGTFLGMVVTFKGAVFALQGSADLQAMRSALAEPIKGLGLAFGTSVAGVAASAMLGLMSAISRRERLELARQLDGRIATVLRPLSFAHQRDETYRALQVQAGGLPRVVDRLEAMMERIEQRSQQLDEQLLARQAQLHRDVTLAYTGLADRVGTSLQDSLVAGARTAGESIAPVVESAMTRIVQDAQGLHARLGEAAQTQVDALSQQFGATARSVADTWHAALADHARTSEALAGNLQRTLASVTDVFQQRSAAVLEAEAGRVEQHGHRMEQLANAWRTQLEALRQDERLRGQAAVDRLGELQAAVAQHLATLGAALEAPIARLLHTAAEVPQAATGVLAQLREEMCRLAERDNAALQERSLLLENIGALLREVNHASTAQRAAIEALVASASSMLDRSGNQFAQALDTHAVKATDLTVHASASALELASLGEAFGHSVQLFQASNDQLQGTLQRVETSINRSTARSDEQLAYYVAQAREVIDLSIASQQGLVDHLRQLQGQPAAPAGGAGG